MSIDPVEAVKDSEPGTGAILACQDIGTMTVECEHYM